MTRHIGNEVANKVLYVGTEAVAGTAVTPDYRLTGQYTANETAALNRTEETTGGFDRFLTASRTPSTFDGSYVERATFQSLPMLLQYGMRRGAAGVTDGETIPGYTYDKFPDFDSDDVASFTAQHYVDGLGFQNTGTRFQEWTLTGDADAAEGAWMFNGSLYFRSNEALAYTEGAVTSSTSTVVTMTGAGWTINAFAGAYVVMNSESHNGEVRLIASNTATTFTVDEAFDVTPTAGNLFRIEGEFVTGIPIPERDIIPTYGTTIKIAPNFAGLAAAETIDDRLISWNVNYAQPLTFKRFMENAINEYSPRTGKGTRIVSGAVRLEYDRRDEWLEWRNTTEIALEISQTGPVIDPDGGPATTMSATITIPKAYWDSPSPDERDTNLTATFSWLAFKHATEPIIRIVTKNDLATLP